MKRQIGRTKIGICTAVAFTVLGAGCMSMQGQGTLDAIAEQAGIQPYVEAYIEYAGPNAKWSGPAPVILHVVAREPGAAKISTTPSLFVEKGAGPTMAKNRAPASASASQQPALGQMTSEMAREQLGALAVALQGGRQSFKGCLSPVRVRLIRADGSLLEKHGCRGQSGWAHAASAVMSTFVSAATFGVPGGIQDRTPASGGVAPTNGLPAAK